MTQEIFGIPLGQAPASDSMPVIMAPDQTPIPVTGSFGPPGTPKFFDYYQSVAGGESDAILVTVPPGKIYNLQNILLDSRFEAAATVYVGTDAIASLRSSPGKPTMLFPWSPYRAVPADAVIKVHLDIISSAPASMVGIWLQASEL